MGQNSRQNIFLMWMRWQFYEAPKFLLLAWNNYLLFSINFFSAPLLLRTLFAPWKKYSWRYPKGFDLAEFFGTLVSNIFSRIIGAFCRVFLIIFGFFFQLFVAVAGLIIFLGWLAIPFIAIGGIIFALLF